jgi:Fic family protein
MKNTGSEYHTMQGTFDSSKGDLRLLGVTAGVGGRSYMNFLKVPAKLEEFCKQLNEQRKALLQTDDVIAKYLLSFEAHFQLVTIHPWVDGNGRMSRLVMNHLQYEFGLIPSKIVKEDKAEYIQSLVDAREQETLAPYREFMAEEHIRNLTREIESFKKSQLADPIKPLFDPIKPSSDPIKEKLYQAIVKDNTLNYAAYAAMIGISEATVKRRLGELKKAGIITRVGSNKNGHWEIIGKGDEL